MDEVRLIDITHDFYSFTHRVSGQAELIISAHGWRNMIKRNDRFLDAFELAELIKTLGACYGKITIASCFSIYLDPFKKAERLVSESANVYQNTLACKLSEYIPNVRVVGFIGEVTSSVDNPQAWELYCSIDNGFGRGLLEMTLSATFRIFFDAIVRRDMHNPCRYIEFLNGKLCQQYGPTININNHVFTPL